MKIIQWPERESNPQNKTSKNLLGSRKPKYVLKHKYWPHCIEPTTVPAYPLRYWATATQGRFKYIILLFSAVFWFVVWKVSRNLLCHIYIIKTMVFYSLLHFMLLSLFESDFKYSRVGRGYLGPLFVPIKILPFPTLCRIIEVMRVEWRKSTLCLVTRGRQWK